MKKFLFLASLVSVFLLSSCDAYYDGYYNNGNNGRKIPPGQAKKMYGGSAKDYAPGQQKKRGYYY